MSPHYKDTFDEVNKAIASAQTLALYDLKEELILEVDVSTKGLCVSHARRGANVICIQILSKVESNCNNIECEGLAVVFSLEHFKAFCYGK